MRKESLMSQRAVVPTELMTRRTWQILGQTRITIPRASRTLEFITNPKSEVWAQGVTK